MQVTEMKAPWSIFLQIALVSAVSFLGSYLATTLDFKSIYNCLWAFLIPAVIAIFMNEGRKLQVVMACLLMIYSLFIVGFSAVFVGFY